MNSFPELITERLKLRKIEISDIDSLIKHVNNPKISDQIFNIPFPYTIEDAIFRMNFVYQGFKNSERYVFAITMKNSDELIGEIGLHLDKSNDSAQFGYWISEDYWNKGIASEATGAIIKFGFEQVNLNKIYATHYIDNIASGKVMINNKMIKEAELIEHYKINNEYRSVNQYRLTRKEYFDLLSK